MVDGDIGPWSYIPKFVKGVMMVKLSPRYVIVTIGNIIFRNNTTCIKCSICGAICDGETQQDQINKLFECLGKHIPAEHLYEVYETEGNKVITQINKEVWDKAKKSTKYRG